ncbi:MAG: peptide chain release factor N(5)-glutamine methyltransferase [Planctomycetota bacterium]|jgi:release factor glutamine methyltransferase
MTDSSAQTKDWKIAPLLKTTEQYFQEKDIESARLDSEVLLASVLNCERIRLYTDFERILSDQELADYRALVKRRALHEPVAYILREKEFYSLKFQVNNDVLIPRPETESLVEEVIKFCRNNFPSSKQLKILDLGTGSGCIAIALAANIKNAKFIATDISEPALHTAAMNSVINKVDSSIEFRQGTLFEPVASEAFDIIVSNPPYIPRGENLMQDVADYEPADALFADNDGLSFYENISCCLKSKINSDGAAFFEVGHDQAERVAAILQNNGFAECRKVKDNNSIERIVYTVPANMSSNLKNSGPELTYEPILEQGPLPLNDMESTAELSGINPETEPGNAVSESGEYRDQLNEMLDKYAENAEECPE